MRHFLLFLWERHLCPYILLIVQNSFPEGPGKYWRGFFCEINSPIIRKCFERYVLCISIIKWWQQISSTSTTGWSRATVFFNIFLTGTKKQKNYITQWFLSTLYIDILIFWCLSMVRWKKLCFSGLCQSSVTAPYCKDGEPRYPPNTSERLQFSWIPLRYPQTGHLGWLLLDQYWWKPCVRRWLYDMYMYDADF